MKRLFLIVLDSFGIGELPDAAVFHDQGSHTLRACLETGGLALPTLASLGLYNIEGIGCGTPVSAPKAAYARMQEASNGKDTTIGHWEIAGLISHHPFPTYPNGFDAEIIQEFEKKCGRKVLCNKPYSGTEVIKDFGEAHMKTGALIVYTSADSVFQIAAHEETVPLNELYRYCEIARTLLAGKHNVGRVIARPFAGKPGNFYRTPYRRDYSLSPTKATILDLLKRQGLNVISIGKINDIFNGCGITKAVKTKSNAEGMRKTAEIAETDFHGLCFTNLVDFDMLYGHRNDASGYTQALNEFDLWLKGFLPLLCEDDILMITADHGCDPSTPSTDHSREYTPLLIYGAHIQPVNLKTRSAFADIGKTIAALFGIENQLDGTDFSKQIYQK